MKAQNGQKFPSELCFGNINLSKESYLLNQNKTESKFSPRSRAKELSKFIKLFKPFNICRISSILSFLYRKLHYNMNKINFTFTESKK